MDKSCEDQVLKVVTPSSKIVLITVQQRIVAQKFVYLSAPEL
jgi:hypothetical protein